MFNSLRITVSVKVTPEGVSLRSEENLPNHRRPQFLFAADEFGGLAGDSGRT